MYQNPVISFAVLFPAVVDALIRRDAKFSILMSLVKFSIVGVSRGRRLVPFVFGVYRCGWDRLRLYSSFELGGGA